MVPPAHLHREDWFWGTQELLLRGLAVPEREEGGGRDRAGEPAEQWPGWVCGLRPKRSELTLSCHQTFQSPAWELRKRLGNQTHIVSFV